MSDIERLLVREDDQEYELFIESKIDTELPAELDEEEPGTRALKPKVDIQKVHQRIRGYTKFALGAFKNFTDAQIEEVTIKFGIKLAGQTGVPFITQSSAEGHFEIEVKCKFPDQQQKSD
ncbi:MAG: CU044_2847 family protein [Coleofasciculus sp. B1-GNL1-01]|uniref:CU044_2847 family protein n=1 Tax=Coleofasciculus sp. B1-GNL1-01 TaxID=3068484 RepID=UPI0032F2703C